MASKQTLQQRSIEKPDNVDIIFKSICLLHNIVIDKEGEEPAAAFTCQQTQSRKRYAYCMLAKTMVSEQRIPPETNL